MMGKCPLPHPARDQRQASRKLQNCLKHWHRQGTSVPTALHIHIQFVAMPTSATLHLIVLTTAAAGNLGIKSGHRVEQEIKTFSIMADGGRNFFLRENL